MNEAAALQLAAESSHGYLATAGSDGVPHLVPIVFVIDGRRVITAVDHKPKTTRSLRRLRNIGEQDRVSVLVDHYEDDWDRLWWVRLDGRALIRDASDALIEPLQAKYPQYRDFPPKGQVIEVQVDTVRWWGP